jgi:hypothetical protein
MVRVLGERPVRLIDTGTLVVNSWVGLGTHPTGPAGDLSLTVDLGLGEQAESTEEREARRSDADLLVIGRSAQSNAGGRMRDLTCAVVRDSPYPVASV